MLATLRGTEQEIARAEQIRAERIAEWEAYNQERIEFFREKLAKGEAGVGPYANPARLARVREQVETRPALHENNTLRRTTSAHVWITLWQPCSIEQLDDVVTRWGTTGIDARGVREE